jgi:hypothetical protein
VSLLIQAVILLALGLLSAHALAWILMLAWRHAVRARTARSRWSPLVAALPPLTGAAVALAVGLPANPVAHALSGPYQRLDHEGWLHLSSLSTGDSWPLLAAAAAVLLSGGGTLAWRWMLVAKGCLIAQRMTRTDGADACPGQADLGSPNAVAAGLLRPRVVVDRRWWSQLDEADRRLVLAHESAHVRRRDPLTLAVLLVLGAFAPRRAFEGVRDAWEDYAEQCADRAAAREIGDPVAVAEALLAHHRSSTLIPGFTTAWTGGRLEARVLALLEASAGDQPVPGPDVDGVLLASLALTCALVLSAAPELHRLIELLVNAI